MKTKLYALMAAFLLESNVILPVCAYDQTASSTGTASEQLNLQSAEINLDELPDSGRVILQNDSDGITYIDITVPSPINPQGSDGWSAGSIPTGTRTLTPNHTGAALSASFSSDVSAYPPVILNAYNQSATGLSWTISDLSASVVTAQAVGGQYAKSQLTFTAVENQDGFTGMTLGAVLLMEIDSSGKVRVSWNY